MLGENGTGKTTFIRMLHGSLKPDEEDVDLPEFRVSYKPQKISPKFPGSVRACCARHALHHESCQAPEQVLMSIRMILDTYGSGLLGLSGFGFWVLWLSELH